VIKIGDFARLGHVSVVTLRHYDEIGLLKPVSVDRCTGYRYYSVTQLPRLNRILALRDLGFSLEQIEEVLRGLTLDHLRGMLQRRHAEVEHHIAQERARLARIATRLRHMESEDTMATSDVVLKTVPSLLVAARRVTIPTNDQVPAYLGPAFTQASAHLKQHGAQATGPCLAIWHQAADVYTDETADAAIPIDRRIPSTAQVQVYELPQQQVAAIVHSGAFEDFTHGHTAILSWVEANGYQITGPYREIYIQQAAGTQAESTTEIQYPVDRAG